jgi:lambda repressor-like predicted transcriptional regulator
VAPKPRPTSREERQSVIYSLRSTGLTMRAIAEATGTSHATVSRTLASTGDPCPHVYPEPKLCSIRFGG